MYGGSEAEERLRREVESARAAAAALDDDIAAASPRLNVSFNASHVIGSLRSMLRGVGGNASLPLPPHATRGDGAASSSDFDLVALGE